MSKNYSDKKRFAVFNKTNGRCAYCGVELEYDGVWHMEHILPRSRGGKNEISNMLATCGKCNCRKHSRTLEEYREHLLELARKHAFDGVFYFESLEAHDEA